MITIPTLQQLYSDNLTNLETEFGSSIPLFGKNFLRVMAAVAAARQKLYYLAIGNLQKNIFVDTADSELAGGTLERFGRIKLGRDPFPAQAGQYTVTVTGLSSFVVPAGTVFKSNDDSNNPGKLFVLDVAFTLSGMSGSVNLRALEAGAGSQLAIGDQLTATAPIPGVDRMVTVTAEIVEPIDSEDLEVYRQKAIQAFQLEPNGGSVGDFRIWAADVPGVVQVYPYAKTGAPGEVNVYVEASPGDSDDGFGTPGSTMLNEVANVIELDPDTTKPINERGRRPMLAIVNVLPVTVRQIDIEVADFQGLTSTVQTAIFNAIEARINRIRPYIAGADTVESKDDILNTNIIINEILTISPGAIFGAVTMLIDSVPVNSQTFINGDIPHLNSITYP